MAGVCGEGGTQGLESTISSHFCFDNFLYLLFSNTSITSLFVVLAE